MTPPPPKKRKEEAEKKALPPRRYGRRVGDAPAQSSSTWLVTFTDAMALMLTFFVLLFAMSNPDAEKWKKMTKNVQQSMQTFRGEQFERGAEDALSIGKIDYRQALSIPYLKVLLQKQLDENAQLEDVTLQEHEGNLVLSLPSDVLFAPAEADLKSGAPQTLYALAATFKRIRNALTIVGHTDPVPVSGGTFQSNWHLSLARAGAVAALLAQMGYDRDIEINAAAAGRYQDLPQSIPEAKRRDISRRVDIVIRPDDGRKRNFFLMDFF